jgi:tetratricopeptide (TPR) repeat protein
MSRTEFSSIVDLPAPPIHRLAGCNQSKELALRIFSRNYLAISVALLGLACGQAEDPLVEIRKLHGEGRHEATIEQLRTLADQDPSRAEVQFLLGSALLFSGNGGLAVWPLRAAARAPEYAIEARLLLVRSMLESRTAPDSIQFIDEVLELEPENIFALVLRVKAYMANGRNEEALVEIDRILELDPDNVAILVPRVTALIATQKIEEAEEAIEIANASLESTVDEEVDPSLATMLCIARGLFAYEKGEPEVAEAQYLECLEKYPVDVFVVQGVAGFYEMIGQRERAIEILEKAFEESGNSAFRMALVARMRMFGKSEEQEQLLRAEAEERPSMNSWFQLANFYVERDEFDEALEAFDHALTMTSDPPESILFAYADTLVQAEEYDKARSIVEKFEESALRDLIIGRILLAQGDPAGALVSFEAGILLWPNNAAGRFLAGQAAERVGNFDRAISDYREAVRAAIGRTRAALELAELYTLRGKYGDALDVVRQYMNAKPGDLDGIVVGVRAAHKARRYGVASEGLQRLSESPENAWMAVSEHAVLLAESGPDGPAEAVKTIEASDLDLTDPANEAALRVLLTNLAGLGDHERAAKRIDSAVGAHSEAAVFHELNGRVLSAAGKPPEKAREAFDRALELDPKHAPALIGLAELSAKAGDIDAALALYDQAAELDPENPAIGLAAAKLEVGAGRNADAQKRFEAVLSKHPREADAAIGLARILAEQREFEKSLDYAHWAEWLRSPEAEETLAWIEGVRAQRGDAGDASATHE